MADAAAKGRTARGDRTATAKLAPEVVRTIRARYAAGGVTQRELAAGLNVSERAINAALSRETWAWVE
jgi:DNA-binding transcriptional regulator LsrR (DeoR family)